MVRTVEKSASGNGDSGCMPRVGFIVSSQSKSFGSSAVQEQRQSGNINLLKLIFEMIFFRTSLVRSVGSDQFSL